MASLEAFAWFVVVGIVGMLCHYAKKWLRGEIETSLYEYLVEDHPKSTILSVGGFVGSAISLWQGGMLDGLNLQQVILLGLTTGFSHDSALNRGRLKGAA